MNGTHEEDGYKIFANNVPKHISFSETKGTHGAQADPEGVVDDPQFGVKLFMAGTIIRTTSRKFISAFVSDDAYTSNSNSFQNARGSKNKRHWQRQLEWHKRWDTYETTAFSARFVIGP